MNAPLRKRKAIRNSTIEAGDTSSTRMDALNAVMDRMAETAHRRGLTPRKLRRILREIRRERSGAGA